MSEVTVRARPAGRAVLVDPRRRSAALGGHDAPGILAAQQLGDRRPADARRSRRAGGGAGTRLRVGPRPRLQRGPRTRADRRSAVLRAADAPHLRGGADAPRAPGHLRARVAVPQPDSSRQGRGHARRAERRPADPRGGRGRRRERDGRDGHAVQGTGCLHRRGHRGDARPVGPARATLRRPLLALRRDAVLAQARADAVHSTRHRRRQSRGHPAGGAAR